MEEEEGGALETVADGEGVSEDESGGTSKGQKTKHPRQTQQSKKNHRRFQAYPTI